MTRLRALRSPDTSLEIPAVLGIVEATVTLLRPTWIKK